MLNRETKNESELNCHEHIWSNIQFKHPGLTVPLQ